MGIVLGSNFTVNTTLPLDDRQTVADTTARDAIDSGRRFEGMIVYVEADEKNYQLVGGITDSDWEELGSGGTTSPLTTKGDLYTFDTVNQRLAIGTNGQVLTADSAQATGMKWADPSAGGAIAVSTTQTLSDTDAITLTQVQRERVKIAGDSGLVTVTLPDGTIDGQEVFVQGTDSDNPAMIAGSGNVFSNGDKTFYAGTLIGYMWDDTDSIWYEIGA